MSIVVNTLEQLVECQMAFAKQIGYIPLALWALGARKKNGFLSEVFALQ